MFCFFFKQKPAYEMRISDWSSDVCSSDLLLILSVTSIITSEIMIGWLRREQIFAGGWVKFSLQSARWLIIAGLYLLAVSLLYYYGQIGRASCRERVCQSV